MKVVIDTNVLVSGLIFGGTPARILSRRLVRRPVSARGTPEFWTNIAEVGRHWLLAGNRSFAPWTRCSPWSRCCHRSERARALASRVCEDPDDDKFLAARARGRCHGLSFRDFNLLRVSGLAVDRRPDAAAVRRP
ncbi:MAG: PIN domain-containing protein, partial [Gemmatimonadetes bacterium]|nr:PIN domain-containing protein [Gemmatimonadota bacterium]